MHKEVLRAIAGVDVFPVISLCMFFAVFAIVLVRTIRLDSARVARCARLPLEESEGAPQ